jgi:serine/threonine protein kinase
MDEAQAPKVSGYTVGRLLGRGGSATVWLATEDRTGRNYALKCLHSAAAAGHAGGAGMDDDAVKREVRILSALDHPHLVKAHQAVSTGAAPAAAGPGEAGSAPGLALVLDYAAGGSLAQLVAVRGRLGIGEAVTVLTPVAQALAYLHRSGFTHLDVSPGNVLFTGGGKPLLSDVGIARVLGEPGRPGQWGTAGFVDPSPVDAVRAGLQPERDVYAAAALGWFCLTGEPPGRTADRPPLSLLVPEVPKDLAAVLEAGLSEDRRLRPTAAALATAVYRSAPPRTLDLAGAVHPTVIPELVTRRPAPLPARPIRRGAMDRLDALQRRVRTTRLPATPWTQERTPAPNLPFPVTGAGHSRRGRHAGPASYVPDRGRNRASARAGAAGPAVAAALVIAAACWLAGAVAAGPGGPAGDSAASAVGPAPGTQGSGAEQGSAVESARSRAAAADPGQALAGLAAMRDHAFNTGNLALLDEVNAQGSAAAAADGLTAARLRADGVVLSGFSSSLAGVATEPGATSTRAVVGATSATSAYEERDAKGAVLAAGAAGPAQALRLVMVRTEGVWRISDILPAAR